MSFPFTRLFWPLKSDFQFWRLHKRVCLVSGTIMSAFSFILPVNRFVTCIGFDGRHGPLAVDHWGSFCCPDTWFRAKLLLVSSLTRRLRPPSTVRYTLFTPAGACRRRQRSVRHSITSSRRWLSWIISRFPRINQLQWRDQDFSTGTKK